MDYPFCNAIGLPIESLLKDSADLTAIENLVLSNGVVLEIKHFLEKNGKGIWELAQLISTLFPAFALTNPKSIQSKIHRLCELKKKLNSKKKVPGYKNISDLLSKSFEPPVKQVPTFSITVNGHEHEQEESPANSSALEPELTCNTGIQTETFDSDDETVKSKNLLQYYSMKLKKKNERLQREISVKQEKLKTQQDKIGYFSIRNINKREEKARQTAKLLRASKNVIKKQKRLLHKAESELLQLGTIKTDNEQLKESVNKLSKTQDLLVYSQKMKLKVQKKVSSLKIQMNRMKVKSEEVKGEIESLKIVLKEKDHQIENLLSDISILKETANFTLVTRNKDASFTDCVRLCVMELSGLEVAVEKVSPVIQTVCKHLFDIGLDTSQLPSSTTVQSIVDEGHYIAKTFISEKLDQSENWGLNRDGTTRRKIKIVDTTITLDSGSVMSLGFNRIAHETAATITKVTQGHLSELSGLNVAKKSIPPQHVRENAADYVARSLEKLAYTMSDRASNEKLANTLLNEWRDEVLLNFELNDDKQTVHSFHCMAHVLLGFHSYVKPELKQLETKLVEVHGPIGRDSLPVFKFWSKKELVIERVLRTTADVFGPVGDHHGVRDRWESHCSSLGIKSLIGNYKDNRFNALFETAAEVFKHKEDFLVVLDTVKNLNLKLKSVKEDLQSVVVLAMLQCFGLFYLKLTGPYWNLISCGKVAYLELYPHVIAIKSFLENCVEDPALMLNQDCHWSAEDPLQIHIVPHYDIYVASLFTLQEETRQLLFDLIKLVAAGMIKCVDKQLVDFLPGGKFYSADTGIELNRTKFAHVTNLACEHHFGDLDSSQRRRPSASMHHHSSVQLLKRNRKDMMHWIQNMPVVERSTMIKDAIKGGRTLREIHMTNEKSVITEVHDEMMQPVKPKKARKKKQNENLELEDEEDYDNNLTLPNIENFTVNDYVAVAYQDNWYPGCVIDIIEKNQAYVKFMSPCSSKGFFQWPSREDRQLVELKFVLFKGFTPDCIGSSGRQWSISQFKDIQSLYELYKNTYF